MNLAAAITEATANFGWMIARPPDQLVEIGRLGTMHRISPNGKRYPWRPHLRDILANDWVVGDLALVVKLLGDRTAAVNGEGG